MRILYCTDTFLPQVNGVTVVTDLSARGMLARGWDVEVIAPRYPRPVAGAPRGPFDGPAHAMRVHGIPSAPAPFYPELRLALPDSWSILRHMRRFAPDIVHCATEFVIGRLGMWAAERLGIPVVTTYHTNFGQYVRAWGWPRLAPRVERYVAGMHRRAWRTYTPSAAAREELGRMGISDVEVWGQGVDTAQFHPDHRSQGLRTRLGLHHAFTYLYVGRLAPEKSVEVVLRAYARVVGRVAPGAVRLVVAGSGPLEPALRSMAPRGTVFLGNLERNSELPALYASADAFVFASSTETLGLVALEAMASGLPVLGAAAGGVATHLRDGENGVAFAPGDDAALADAMFRVATVPSLREVLGDGALATARPLSWEVEFDRLDAGYRTLCARATAVRNLPLRLGLRKK
jgi:glycosyltransferase involved in cell wall biosynthesis